MKLSGKYDCETKILHSSKYMPQDIPETPLTRKGQAHAMLPIIKLTSQLDPH